MALNLEADNVGVVIFGSDRTLKKATQSSAPTRSLTFLVGDELLGRVVDGLGNPIDGKGPIKSPSVALRKLKRRALSHVNRFTNQWRLA